MKATALISLAVLAFACGSKDDDDKGAGASGGKNGAGATGGTSMISLTGGSSSGGTSGNSASGGSANGSGTITMETAADLRAKACVGSNFEPELLPVVLMLVVDNSASMNERPRNSQSTKWEVTRTALAQTIDTMPPTAAVGVLYYPNMNTMPNPQDMLDNPRPVTACVNTEAMIPISELGDSGSDQRERISRSLDDTSPKGSTPTHDAYDYALVNGMQASNLTGNRFMLLITDGAPTFKKNCEGGGMPNTPQPTQPIIEEVLSARQDGVRSFIIGSPGSESVNGVDVRSWLSQAAVLGATARSGCSLYGPDFCHIDLSQDADFAGALNAALARILGLITSCTFDVPATGKDGQPVQRDQINVIYTPGRGAEEQLIGRDDSPNCQDGWQFDADGRLVLCPNTCALAQSTSGGSIELLFGCDSVNTGEVK